MKRLSNTAGSLLGLLVLIAAALAFATLLRGFQQGAEPNSLVGQATLPGYPPPAYPPPDETPSIEPPGLPSPAPLPDQGVRVGPPNEIDLTKWASTIERLYTPTVDGDTLVGTAKMPGGGFAIVKMDLNTGLVQNIGVESQTGFGWLGFSGTDVAWVDVLTQENLHSQYINILNLQSTGQAATQVGPGDLRQPDLKDGILVWEELRNGTWGVYGYDLRASKSISIDEGDASFPHVCSQNWVIYLKNLNGQIAPLGSADLHAHNLATGEDVLIGQVPFPRDMPVQHQVACDGDRVAWISVRAEQLIGTEANPETGQTVTSTTTIPVAQYHLYDLNTRADRLLDMPGQGFAQIFLKGDILVSTNGYVGYDLGRNVPFSLLPSPDFLRSLRGGISLVQANDGLVWLSDSQSGNPQHLYVTPIIRNLP